MWVWQSQAPAGTSKFTGVAGCEALAKPVRRCMAAPAAIAPIRTSRRVSMGSSLFRIHRIWDKRRLASPRRAGLQVFRLLQLDSGVADHRGPALELGSDDAPELLRAAAHRVRALLEEFLLYFGQVKHTGDFLLHARDDRIGRLCRGEQREPGIDLVVGEVQLFGDGRDLGRRWIALERGHRERTQFP